MALHPNLPVALRALERNTLQTSLTILGMTIGVAAVLTMIGLGTGAEAAIEDQVRAAGMNLIMVTAGNYKPKIDDDFGGAVEPSARLEEDLERLVVPISFHPEDNPMEKHDHPTARQRFGEADPVGRDVVIWNQPFRVAGVVTTTSWVVAPAPGDDQFDAVYVPFTTIHRLLNLTKLNDITITAASTGDVTRLMKEVTDLLRARHQIGAASPDDFTVTTQARQTLAKGGLRPEIARAVVGNV